MEKAKRIFMVLAIVTILTTCLTGCNQNSNVISKWDSKEISLYSDYSTMVELTVQIRDGSISYTSKKELELSAGEPLNVTIQDFEVSSFFSENAEIYNVSIGSSKTYSLIIAAIIVLVLAITIVVCIVAI